MKQKYRSQEFARYLAGTGAAKFGMFKLKSGITSNIFINFGNICSGQEISDLGSFFARYIVENKLHNVDALFGPAYKGIDIAIATSIALWKEFSIDVPFAYNRKTPKTHGEGGRFIGFDLSKAKSVLALDDVITDGLTKYETIEMLSSFPQLRIEAFVIGVDRQDVDPTGTPWREKFEKDTGIKVFALTQMAEVLGCRDIANFPKLARGELRA